MICLWIGRADFLFQLTGIITKMSAIVGHISENHFRHIANRFRSAGDKHVGRIGQISIDVFRLQLLSVVENQLRRQILIAETHDDAMDVGFERSLAVPTESPMCKIDAEAVVEELLPQIRHLLALTDAVGRDKRRSRVGAVSHQVGRLLVPAADIIHIAHILPFRPENVEHILFLAFAHQTCAHKRRVAHNVVEVDLIAFRVGLHLDDVPIHSERVALAEVDVVTDDLLRLRQHLRLGNPERGRGDGDGEVVDFDAVELLNRDLNRVLELAHHHLAVVALADDFVFQSPQRQISLREEIAASAGRVEERERRQTVLEGIEQFLSLALGLLLKNFVEFAPKVV